MDHQFCPGAKILRQPQPEMFDCPSCGEEVEIWTDEIRGVCSNCGQKVFRDGFMSCLEWCKFAADCVGEEAYDRFMKNRAFGLRRKLLEAVHKIWDQEEDRVRAAEAVLSWSEEILKVENADWHIVIPASILHNISGGSGSNGLQTAKEILLRSGLMSEEIEKICRIIDQDPAESSIEFDVVHDAVLLAHSEPHRPAKGALRTETAKRLSLVSSPGA
ncbi:MAG: hypothetical protein JSV89_19365 [Spirochaetaceae bacterium]|nr:MAG: hypothetical protein JSV89_19365 [Spirochaetaceae bacterium]